MLGKEIIDGKEDKLKKKIKKIEKRKKKNTYRPLKN